MHCSHVRAQRIVNVERRKSKDYSGDKRSRLASGEIKGQKIHPKTGKHKRQEKEKVIAGYAPENDFKIGIDRDYVEFLKKMTASLGLTKRVKFFGFVNQEDKFVLLAKSHVMVNPSIREGWGLVNIEANAVGTPVVAYNSQGLIDSIKDGLSGIICRENTPQMLAQQIHDLVTDKNRFAFLAKGALAWSKNFTWEKSRQLSLVLISKIFSGSHPVE